MLPVNKCKSSDFSLPRLRSKVVGVACETEVGGLFLFTTTICLCHVTFIDKCTRE